MLENFRLFTIAELKTKPSYDRPYVYAICFDVEGLLVKIGWTLFPANHLSTLVKGQAAPAKEIWLADAASYLPESNYKRSQPYLRGFARKIKHVLGSQLVRDDLFRVPMRSVDNAFTAATSETFSWAKPATQMVA